MEFDITKAFGSSLLTFGVYTGTVTMIIVRQFFYTFLKSCQHIMSVYVSKYLSGVEGASRPFTKTSTDFQLSALMIIISVA